MRCVVVRHVSFEDLGIWEDELFAQGYEVEYLEAGVDDLSPLADAPLAVVLGGPIGVGDAALYPTVGYEIGLLRERLAAELPTIGVCLGAQFIAAALGARVSSGTPEIGWGTVDVTDAGRASALRHLEGAPVLHWHGDACELPQGATLLASTTATAVQAFSHGNTLALQFHAEADPERIEQWLIGHTGELRSHGIDIAALRERTREVADEAVMAGIALLREHLKMV
jgi:GMP synthase (glutamine-hydrolysing)